MRWSSVQANFTESFSDSYESFSPLWIPGVVFYPLKFKHMLSDAYVGPKINQTKSCFTFEEKNDYKSLVLYLWISLQTFCTSLLKHKTL